uniref:Cathepsin L n=1 Tax=Caligus clemensi TaxID=344056 RepID=C1C0V0_CALCM|nr:Cathepsin L precursor [Caligus clemensi]
MKCSTLLLSVLVIASTANAVSFFDVVLSDWESWKLMHGKTYSSSIEEKLRLKIYMENSLKISRHNSEALNGIHPYYMKMNHYGDLLHHEFVAMVNGYQYANKTASLGGTYIPNKNIQLPTHVDWREEGAVTPVKNQGQCGSCWSFSATGALEGQDFRKTGKLISLSEQNLVDCSRKFGNNGCEGGLMDFAFTYIRDNKGIDTEASYPYEGIDGHCHYNPKNKGGSDIGFVDIKKGSEKDLKKAVAGVGPISVAIDASHMSFQFYSHGVYVESKCSSEELDHGVLVVGFGTDSVSGEDYWLVKNSWSEKWGDQGYIKMARNKENMCGIASSASYPVV